MKLAIFGGSGVVGQTLLPRLLADGHQIRAMRHQSPLPVEGIEVVQGSLAETAAVAETLADAEVVVQMTKGGSGIEQVVETAVRGTVNVLDAIRARGGVRQYLLTSSDAATGIWSHPHPQPISHATEPFGYGGYYSLAKVLEEVIVADYHRNEGLPFTIARLSFVMREDLALRLFLAEAGRGPFDSNYTPQQKARLAAGERFVVLPVNAAGEVLGRTLVQREDVVDALAAMIGADAAIGQRFHLSGAAFGYEKPCRHLAEKLGLPVERVVVPDAHSFEIDYSLTTELLGWSPKFDVLAMLDAALAWRNKRQP